MADEADLAQDQIEQDLERSLAKIKPYELPPGVPGDCDFCGVHSPRLIDGGCAACRDARTKVRPIVKPERGAVVLDSYEELERQSVNEDRKIGRYVP